MYKQLIILFIGLVLCAQARDSLVSNADNVLHSSSALVSPDNTTQLVVLADGNVVLSSVTTGQVYWSTKTANAKGVAPYQLIMQGDGNLVVVDSISHTFWSSNTANHGCAPYTLALTDPISLGVVDCAGVSVWAAHIALGTGSNAHKRSNPCYGVITTCTNSYGLTAGDLSFIAGVIEEEDGVEDIFIGIQDEWDDDLTVIYFPSTSFSWWSNFGWGATCHCSGSGYYIIVSQ